MKTHAAIVLRNDNNEILFVKRSMIKKTLPGIWSFASGTLEEGESSFDTAVREAKEELGVDINVERLITSCELPELNVRLDFILCNFINDEPKILDYIDNSNNLDRSSSEFSNRSISKLKTPILKIDHNEIEKFEWMKFEDFFNRFNDSEIGHGLIWLRQNKDLLNGLI